VLEVPGAMQNNSLKAVSATKRSSFSPPKVGGKVYLYHPLGQLTFKGSFRETFYSARVCLFDSKGGLTKLPCQGF
jgi:hypothetical protein